MINETPLVSVIIPCYNSGSFVAEAIESALGQSYRSIEVIVVDDASDDNSLAIAKSYEPRIMVIANRRNRERSWSRNIAVKHSNGDFIAFLDSDDIWKQDKLDRQIELFQDVRVSVVYSNAYLYKQEAIYPCYQPLLYGSRIRYPIELPIVNPEYALFVENPIVPSTAIVRKSAFIRVKGFALERSILGAEDLDLWLRLALIGGSFRYLDEPLVYYRQHEAQTTSNADFMCKCVFSVMRRHIRDNDQVMQVQGCRDSYTATLKRLETIGVRSTYRDHNLKLAISTYWMLMHAAPWKLAYWKGFIRAFFCRLRA